MKYPTWAIALSLILVRATIADVAAEPRQALYGSSVQRAVKVRMSDGVDLDATIGYPTELSTGKIASGLFPVILQQDPYFEKPPSPPVVNTFFVERGYIFVNVAPRGTQASAGTFDYWGPRSAEDGKDIVDWVAHKLTGSNGIIGLYGCSYMGVNGIATAEAVTPDSGVRALVTECPVANVYRDYMPAGIPTEIIPLLPMIAALTGDNPTAKQHMIDLQSDIMAGNSRAYAGDHYWVDRDFVANSQRIVDNYIATLIWEGWQSQGPRSDIEFFTALQNAAQHRPIAGPMDQNRPPSGRYQIIIGPWAHGAGLDDTLNLQWFDTFLKDASTEVEHTRTPMHLYEGGSNRWVNAASYPMARKYTSLYLNNGNSLLKSKPGGSGSDSIAGGASTQPGATLVYQTQPFVKGATLAGPISATVFASTTNTNLELILTLSSIAPDGNVTIITDGAILGSMRDVDRSKSWFDENGMSIRPYHPLLRDEYLKPGLIGQFDVELFPKVQAIPPGYSVRMTITTTPPTCVAGIGHDPCYLTAPQQHTVPGGTYSVQRSSRYPSVVNLPLLPYGYFTTARSGPTSTSKGVDEPLDWGH
jgi:uncharacterized protein